MPLGLPQGRSGMALLSQSFAAAVTPGVSTAQGCGVLPGIPGGCTQRSTGPSPAPSFALLPRVPVALAGVGDGVVPLGTGSGLLGPPFCLAAECGVRSCQTQVKKLWEAPGRAGKGWERPGRAGKGRERLKCRKGTHFDLSPARAASGWWPVRGLEVMPVDPSLPQCFGASPGRISRRIRPLE